MIKTKNLEGAKVVTANRLRDGAVVFLAADGLWSLDVDDGAVARDDASAAALLEIGAKAAAAQVVVAPYLIEVNAEDGRIVPLTYRERIRAFGPSTGTPGSALRPDPHPALSRKRERVFTARAAPPPLPLAGEGRGEGGAATTLS